MLANRARPGPPSFVTRARIMTAMASSGPPGFELMRATVIGVTTGLILDKSNG